MTRPWPAAACPGQRTIWAEISISKTKHLPPQALSGANHLIQLNLIQSQFQWLLSRYWVSYKRDSGHVAVMHMIIAVVKRDNLARQVRATDVAAIQFVNQVAEKVLLGMSCD